MENTNTSLIDDLNEKSIQLQDMEKQLKEMREEKITNYTSINHTQKENKDSGSLIMEDLIEENNNLKQDILFIQENFEDKKMEYKLRIDKLENTIAELTQKNNKTGSPVGRLSLKKKSEVIRLENELRQKNIYIKRLLTKLHSNREERSSSCSKKGLINSKSVKNKRK